MEQEPQFKSVSEKENKMIDIQTSLIPELENGFGYGSGSISRESLAEATQEKLNKLHEVVTSGEIIFEVDRGIDGKILDDDGCGDGRGVKSTFIKIRDAIVSKSRSLRRAKVFGGGPAMAGAAQVATGDIEAESTEDVFMSGISALKFNKIGFGGHTADHASGFNCGCGAIDNAPAIFKNSIAFKDDITGSFQKLGLDTDGLDVVFARFQSHVERTEGEDYSGRKVMDEGVIDSGVFVKELEGDHKEVAVVLNMVPGYTVDQEKVREVTDGLQVFAVDVWRMQDIAARLFPHDEAKQAAAFNGMLVYTLATASTLTSGDLPVYISQAQESLVTA